MAASDRCTDQPKAAGEAPRRFVVPTSFGVAYAWMPGSVSVWISRLAVDRGRGYAQGVCFAPNTVVPSRLAVAIQQTFGQVRRYHQGALVIKRGGVDISGMPLRLRGRLTTA